MSTDLRTATTADAGTGEPPTSPTTDRAGPRARREPRRLAGAALPVVTTLGLLGIWELLARTGVLPPEIPPVTTIFAALVETVPTARFGEALVATIEQFAVGLAIGGVAGIALGVLLGGVPVLYRLTHYLLDFLRSIPAVVYLPVLILVLGATPRVSYLLGAVGALWPLLFQTYYGVAGVPPLLRDTGRVFGLRLHQRLLHITLPAVSPFVATGLRIAASHVLVVVVAVEIISSVEGIGADIAVYATNAVYPEMYALVLVVGALGVLVNWGLQRLERWQLHWHTSYRGVSS
jgi:ABC-type nitrate/sulfonate/bicarbonate transport system permease component